MADDPILLKRLDHSKLFITWHFRIDAVQLPESDLLQPEPFAAFDCLLTQIFGATIAFPLTRTGSPQSRLGSDKNTVIGMECLADELLGDMGPIGSRGVDEIESKLRNSLKGSDRFRSICRRTPDAWTRE